MKKTFAAKKKNGGFYPVYESDIKDLRKLPESDYVMLSLKEKGIPRSYQELKLYWACVNTTAINTEDINWDTKSKVHIQCKIL